MWRKPSDSLGMWIMAHLVVTIKNTRFKSRYMLEPAWTRQRVRPICFLSMLPSTAWWCAQNVEIEAVFCILYLFFFSLYLNEILLIFILFSLIISSSISLILWKTLFFSTSYEISEVHYILYFVFSKISTNFFFWLINNQVQSAYTPTTSFTWK